MDTTIIFCTDNSAPADIFKAVTDRLRAVEVPIVSVSHTPVDLGNNIVIGKQKRSWLTLYRQLLTGLEAADTQYIHIAEHDCFYTSEHWAWEPPRDDIFYYNENVWLVQWSDKHHPELKGQYSRFWTQRLALSQLVCNRELYLNTLHKRLDIIDKDRRIMKGIDHIGEPGVSKISKAQKWANSGRPVYLKEFIDTIELEKYETFETELPNLDVRHDKNFTGPRRGRKRTMEAPFWGRFEDVIRG